MSGLLNHLHITKEYALPNTEKLPMLRNGDSSDVAKKTIDYLDRALTRHGYKLTKIGKNYFGRLLGEIVDNCQNHAGEHATWYTLGHYNYDIENNIGKCRLTICDFGNTIYESLKYHSTQRILKKVNHYTKKVGYHFVLFAMRKHYLRCFLYSSEYHGLYRKIILEGMVLSNS